MFGQSAFVAAIASEAASYLLRNYSDLSAEQIALCKAIIALASGGTCSVSTADPIGGLLTIPIVVRALMQTNLPPEVRSILVSIGPIVTAAAITPFNHGMPGVSI